jgi:hypothetical protein
MGISRNFYCNFFKIPSLHKRLWELDDRVTAARNEIQYLILAIPAVRYQEYLGQIRELERHIETGRRRLAEIEVLLPAVEYQKIRSELEESWPVVQADKSPLIEIGQIQTYLAALTARIIRYEQELRELEQAEAVVTGRIHAWYSGNAGFAIRWRSYAKLPAFIRRSLNDCYMGLSRHDWKRVITAARNHRVLGVSAYLLGIRDRRAIVSRELATLGRVADNQRRLLAEFGVAIRDREGEAAGNPEPGIPPEDDSPHKDAEKWEGAGADQPMSTLRAQRSELARKIPEWTSTLGVLRSECESIAAKTGGKGPIGEHRPSRALESRLNVLHNEIIRSKEDLHEIREELERTRRDLGEKDSAGQVPGTGESSHSGIRRSARK